MLEYRQFEELARQRGSSLISIYLPTHRFGPDVEGDPIRLKNLISETIELAAERGDLAVREIQQRLEPAKELVDDAMFWRHQGDGLALLLSDLEPRRLRLPTRFEPLSYMGERFCVRPLIPAVSRGQVFFVLALSQKSVRLLSCTRSGAREVDLHDIPSSLLEAVGYDWEERSLQFHTGAAPKGGGERAAVFHGQGGGSEESKNELERFLRRVDEGLRELTKAHTAPLIVAAVDYVIAMYHRISRYPTLVEGGIEGNPQSLSAEQLHERALEKVAARLDASRHQRIRDLRELAATEGAATDIETVLNAARDGRVETLFVRSTEPCWGTYDREASRVEVHDRREPNDDDLFDLAVSLALSTGAEPVPIDSDEMPGEVTIAALLRF